MTGRTVVCNLNNGKTGDAFEELWVSIFQGDGWGWLVRVSLGSDLYGWYEWVDTDHAYIAKGNSFAWCKIARMAVRELVMRKLDVKEPMTYLRSNERAWMDNFDKSMFSPDKWVEASW